MAERAEKFKKKPEGSRAFKFGMWLLPATFIAAGATLFFGEYSEGMYNVADNVAANAGGETAKPLYEFGDHYLKNAELFRTLTLGASSASALLIIAGLFTQNFKITRKKAT